MPTGAIATTTGSTPPAAAAPAQGPSPSSDRLDPDDLVYVGAFRLPPDPAEQGWEWGGAALTYYPQGDPAGPDDGFPGSLFGTGHDWTQQVSEISIPVPVIGGDLDALSTAETLQPFADIRGDLFDFSSFELPRAGLEYLDDGGDRLHFAWGQHYEDDGPVYTHGSAGVDLGDPDPAGPWRIGGAPMYASNDYLFTVDPDWAAANTPGMLLATGRFRDGGWGGQGPSLYVYDPGGRGGPPETQLPAVALLQYGSSLDDSDITVDGYHQSDEWNGGAWLRWRGRAAVVFAGTKGIGECWYGFENGVVWPDEPPHPSIPDPPYDDRGWWSSRFEAQFLFYDPGDLAAVASGELGPHQPQPYAAKVVDDVLFAERRETGKGRLGAAAFDAGHGLLYALELHGDEDRPVVHVWRIGG